MGQRGADREPATSDEIAEMRRIVADGVAAGALGVSTSRSLNHRSSKGAPTPSLTAEYDELLGLAMGLKDAGRGVFAGNSSGLSRSSAFQISLASR